MTVVASNFERRAHDLYETPAWVTKALLRRFPIDGMIVWEPAAGNHMMVDVLKKRAEHVRTSDIKTYDRAHDFEYDFLNQSYLKGPRLDCIITNPPYGKGNRDAVKFCECALARCDKMVAMLLTAKFDFGKTRHHLFRDNPRFIAKINLVDRISWAGNGKTGTEDNAWYVWGPALDVSIVPAPLPVIYYEGKQ